MEVEKEDIHCAFDVEDYATSQKSTRALKISLVIAFLFMALEIVGGIIAKSLVLISDALHMMTDAGTFLLSLSIIHISRWPRTSKMSFGYHRAEVLGALGNVISLWALCAVLVYEGIYRLIHPEIVNAPLMLIIGAIGLCSNISMYFILHSSKEESLNVKAAFIHVLGDLLGTVGVILSGILIWTTKINRIDPIVSILFAILISLTSFRIFRKSVRILMEGAPEHIDPEEVKSRLLKLPVVKDIKDLHYLGLRI